MADRVFPIANGNKSLRDMGDGSLAEQVVAASGGLGVMVPISSQSANGSVLGAKPAGCCGVRIYCGASDSVTFTVGTSQPSSPPPTYTVTGQAWDEGLIGDANVYITAYTGSPSFRWY